MANRVAVVTGGSGGIGRAICMLLSAQGHRVIAVSRGEAGLRDLRELAASHGQDVETRQCDVTDEHQIRQLAEDTDGVDIVVNNAGMSATNPVHKTSLEDWRAHFEVNATSAFLVVRAFLPAMKQAGWGRIVSIASTAARAGTPYTAAYSASKHAMLGLSRVVASEVAGTGVTSNAVCPGFVRTAMTQRSVERISARTGRDSSDAQAALTAASPLGRLLEPDEVAAAVSYLVSEEAGCVNGQALVLDGGGLQQ